MLKKDLLQVTELNRDAISVGGRAKLSNKFTIASTLNYSYTDFETPPVAASYGSNVGGENASIFGNLFYTPRSVDLMGLPFQKSNDRRICILQTE